MHVAIITPKFIPNAETGGAALYNLSLIRLLREQGHPVTLIHFDSLAYNPLYPSAAADLTRLGVEVVSFTPPAPVSRMGLLRRLEDSFPNVGLAPQVVPYLQTLHPDLVFCYGEDGLAATHGLDGIPVAVQLGDPIHLIRLIRWQYDLFWGYPFGFNLETLKWPWRLLYSGLETLPGVWAFPGHLKTLLEKAALLVTVIPQQTGRYANLSGKPCHFTPVPLPDTIGPDWEKKRAACISPRPTGEGQGEGNPKRAKLLWVGKLGNTENRYAVLFFVRQLYPELVKKLGRGNFEVRFVGNPKNCPPELTRLVQSDPNLQILGHVPDIDAEFLSAEVYLVTNTTTLGARTRILSSFAAGSCVVAHVANTAGVPALKHRENALIGQNAPEMAALVAEALANPELRLHLGRNGRKVFENQYQLEKAAQSLVELFAATLAAGAGGAK